MDTNFDRVLDALFPKPAPSLEESISSLLSGFRPNDVRKRAAWDKTQPLGRGVIQYPPDARIDHFGNIICWSHYGRYDSEYGWEIDHINPKSFGGSDHPDNLRALSCRKNRSLGGIISQFARR